MCKWISELGKSSTIFGEYEGFNEQSSETNVVHTEESLENILHSGNHHGPGGGPWQLPRSQSYQTVSKSKEMILRAGNHHGLGLGSSLSGL